MCNYRLVQALVVSLLAPAVFVPVAAAQEVQFLQAAASHGNQQSAAFSMGHDGGFMVWQDDRIDGRGWGIGLRRLRSDFSPDPASPVQLANMQKSYHQEAPDVACLSDGSAIVVWQGGKRGMKDIYYRMISPRGTWLTEERFVNVNRAGDQVEPSVVALPGGDAFVAWTSVNQEGAYRGVFGRRIVGGGGGTPAQIRLSNPSGKEDKAPSLASLGGDGFVCVWIAGSKSYWRGGAVEPGDSVVLARVFNSVGQPSSVEINVSADGGAAYGCSVASTAEGFVVAWLDRTARQPFIRRHSASGQPLGQALPVAQPSHYLDAIDIASIGEKIVCVWGDRMVTDRNRRIYSAYSSIGSQVVSVPQAVSAVTDQILQAIQPTIGSIDGAVGLMWSSYRTGSAFDVVGTQIR